MAFLSHKLLTIFVEKTGIVFTFHIKNFKTKA